MQQYRPLIHYSPKINWMNDPNGLVYYDGEWHLFYQHYPREPIAKNIHWGHAVSEDLITWTELPIAITPEDEEVGIWSGSVVIDRMNITGFQKVPTAHGKNEDDKNNIWLTVSIEVMVLLNMSLFRFLEN